jgi:hypothetical protein
MFVPSEYLTLKLTAQRSRECTERAKRTYRLRKARIDQRGWIEMGLCRVVSAIGCLLVALGKRLESANRPSVAAPRASNA